VGHSLILFRLIGLLAERVGFDPHGTITPTTVYEFEGSHAASCRLVTKRALLFANFALTMSACDL
jgi:hypothetical protein